MYDIQIGANNPILRKQSTPIQTITSGHRDLAQHLREMMVEYDGVGLAAPQIGVNECMVCVTKWKRQGTKMVVQKERIMINPTIISHGDTTKRGKEACISLPNVQGDVQRWKEIKIQYLDLEGETHTEKLKNYNARIVQHEIDHLDGILFIDKIVR